MFALLSTLYFDVDGDEKINRKDIGFIIFFSLSLITKHILFLLPVFILLMDKLSFKKKVLYAFVPPMMFLFSFVPFAFLDRTAFQGIIDNVFRYRSSNNAPLFRFFYRRLHFPEEPRIIVYVLLMIIIAYIVRKYSFDYIMLIYLIAMVAFSPAIANQYLVIPMAALCILNVGKWDKIYMALIGFYLIFDSDGFGVADRLQTHIPGSVLARLCESYVRRGYVFAAWILVFSLIFLMRFQQKYKRQKKE